MAAHNETGRIGEDLAAAYFEQRGYVIVHRNWRHRSKEVDIIATKEGMLHFIEVKTASSRRFGNPEEKISAKKIRCLIDASAEFLYQFPQWQRIQFDVLAVTLSQNAPPEYFLIEDLYE